MTRATGLVVTLAFLSSGCRFGMTAGKYQPAHHPQGVMMEIETGQGKVAGELIEVRDAGIVVLADQKLRLVPYTAIVSSKVDQTSGSYSLSKGVPPRPDVRAQLRLLSRFPQGLTPELLAQLLSLHGQTELDGAKP